jgi:hypothetical protein
MWKLLSCLLLWLAASCPAQLARPGATPRPLLPPSTRLPLGATPAPVHAAPPREIPLVEKKFEQLSNPEGISADGRLALSINPSKWRHTETENFIVHYRRATEAQKVVREVEYDLWHVASVLGAGRDRYARKSHVYVFEDEGEWKQFLQDSANPFKFAASYAYGDELFLNVRGGGNSGPGTSFDSQTLAHEATHAVVARLYPRKRWPLWLNEGFAEYMAGASIAARKGQRVQRYERELRSAKMPLETLVAIKTYPQDEAQRRALYETGEMFVRFLMTEGGAKERITKFVEAILEGRELHEAVLSTYGDKFKDWEAFVKGYERFAAK